MAFTVRRVAPQSTRRSCPSSLFGCPTFNFQFWARGSCEHLFDTASRFCKKLQRRGELFPGSGAAALATDEQHSTGYLAAIRSVASGAAAGTFGKFVVYPMDTVKKRLQVCRGHSILQTRGTCTSDNSDALCTTQVQRRLATQPLPPGYTGPPRAPVYHGTLHCLWTIAREEGIIRGLYRGETAGKKTCIVLHADISSLVPTFVVGTVPSLLKAGLTAATLFGGYDAATALLLQHSPFVQDVDRERY